MLTGWTPGEVTALFGVLAAPAAGILTWLQWWIKRLDTRVAAAKAEEDARRQLESKRQDDAREEMREDFEKRINELNNLMKVQGGMLALYVRHVRSLEILIAQNGLTVPPFEVPDHLKEFWYASQS